MSISLDNLSSLYNMGGSYTDVSTQKLQETLKEDLSKASDEGLKEVCQEFETYFTQMVFKEMMKTVPEYSDKDADPATKQMKSYFKEELLGEWAKMSASRGGGIGLASQMYEQIKRNYKV